MISQPHSSSCYLKHLLVQFFLASKCIFVFEIEIGKNSQIDRRIKNNNNKKSAECCNLDTSYTSCCLV